MKYNIGDKIILRDDLEAFKPYGGIIFVESINRLGGKPITIEDISIIEPVSYEINGWHVTDEMIDHEATYKLNKKNSGITWSEILEKIKNQENVYVNCLSEKDASELLYNLDILGYEWQTGASLVDENYYYDYLKETCYGIREDGSVIYFCRSIFGSTSNAIYEYIPREKEVKSKIADAEQPVIYSLWEVAKEISKCTNKVFRSLEDSLIVDNLNKISEITNLDGKWVEIHLDATDFVNAFRAFRGHSNDIVCLYFGGYIYFDGSKDIEYYFSEEWLEIGEWFIVNEEG